MEPLWVVFLVVPNALVEGIFDLNIDLSLITKKELTIVRDIEMM
jgi:hypothetical protein